MAKFRGKATRDNVKVEVEDGEGNARFYFAQCEAHFQDANGHVSVGLRWHDHANPNGDIVDGTVGAAASFETASPGKDRELQRSPCELHPQRRPDHRWRKPSLGSHVAS
jgi:hypothetical protein